MKTRITITVLAAIITAGMTLKAQDYPQEYLGLPGDNLNLYAVMNTFQESRNLRVFERNLNDPDERINNLDLNGDNLVDYIMVYDNLVGNVHYIVLRVALNRNESQDVAVFTVQRFNNGQVYVQLTGDESLYGKNYIIEPASMAVLASWPLIKYIYRPNYTLWYSDWYWGYYPDYWTPWRPSYWHYYYGYHYNWNKHYYSYYHRSYAHNDAHWNDHYYIGHRVWSPAVTNNVHAGSYRSTYSHPEKMKEGEEQYRNKHPEAGRRSTYSTSTGNTTIRYNNSNATSRRSADTETSYRNSDESYNVSNDRESRTLKEENTTRRIATETTRSTIGNSGSGRTISEGRTSSQATARPASRPEQSQSVSTARPASRPEQSQSVSTARPATRTEQSQSVSQSRSSEQSRNVSAAPARKSGGEEKVVRNTESNKNENKSESSSASRRK
jgi:hypothetical protein